MIPDLEEPQLAEMTSSNESIVILNGRQNNSFPLGSPCGCRGQVYSSDGLTWQSCAGADCPHSAGATSVDWLPSLPSPSVQSSIFRSPRSGRLVFAGPRSHDREARVNMTVTVSPSGASAADLWGGGATHIPLRAPACAGYKPNCAGYSCLAADAGVAAGQEGVLLLWETGVASGCSGAACRIMLSRVRLPSN